eukprot:Rmarinus@m.24046
MFPHAKMRSHPSFMGSETELSVYGIFCLPMLQCRLLVEDENCYSENYARLRNYCDSHGLRSARFIRVPGDYYNLTLEQRRDLLQATSVTQLLKTMIVVNSSWTKSEDCEPQFNSKHYAVVLQYGTTLNGEKVAKLLRAKSGLGKRSCTIRLAEEKEMQELSGYARNAVSPLGMRANVPMILSESILNVQPAFIWMGAGEVDLKVGVPIKEFVQLCSPLVGDICHSKSEGSEDELDV